MRRGEHERALREEVLDERGAERPAFRGVGPGADLVEDDERGELELPLHVDDLRQVRREGREVGRERLVVSDVGEDRGEDRNRGGGVRGDVQPAQRHQAQEPRRLQRDGLAAGVGPREDETASPPRSARSSAARARRAAGGARRRGRARPRRAAARWAAWASESLAFAWMRSSSPRTRAASSSEPRSGRIFAVSSRRTRRTSWASRSVSSAISLPIETAAIGSTNTVAPLDEAPCTIPGNWDLHSALTGSTDRPPRVVTKGSWRSFCTSREPSVRSITRPSSRRARWSPRRSSKSASLARSRTSPASASMTASIRDATDSSGGRGVPQAGQRRGRVADAPERAARPLGDQREARELEQQGHVESAALDRHPRHGLVDVGEVVERDELTLVEQPPRVGGLGETFAHERRRPSTARARARARVPVRSRRRRRALAAPRRGPSTS